jgi:glycosyltransferase involved in cell wall biosynthesis
LIAPSNWIANAASLSPIFSGSRIEVLPQPIDSLFFNFVKRRVIRKPASQTRELTLGIVAANLGDPLKGVKKAVSLFKSIRRDGDRLFLVGSGGSELASDSARIISKGVLSGEALADVLVSLDALIVFSEYDNTPLVVSEALALGTPVIGKKVGGIPELVSHGTTGWLVSDEMGLAQTIQSLRSLDAEVIGRMSENCMIEARLKFHPTKVAQRHLDLYLE